MEVFNVKEFLDDKVNIGLIASHLSDIMSLLEIPITESNKDTPYRVAKMWVTEIFANRNNSNIQEELIDKIKLFPNDYTTGEIIVIKDIPFNSTCEHHWLPFSGTVSVGYVPSDKIIGLSKVPRVVKYFSKQPQLQEKLTANIGEFLFDCLSPYALFVKVSAKHQCVMCRGAESDCTTETYFKKFLSEEYQKQYEKFGEKLK